MPTTSQENFHKKETEVDRQLYINSCSASSTRPGPCSMLKVSTHQCGVIDLCPTDRLETLQRQCSGHFRVPRSSGQSLYTRFWKRSDSVVLVDLLHVGP